MAVTPLGALGRGLAAGLAGTGAMTALQEAMSSGGDGGGEEGTPSWDDAPAPARVARRILEGVFKEDVSPERIPLLTNVMHWAYGTGWGAVYGLVQGTIRASPILHGAAFGAVVWAGSYAQLVPMGLYSPPWTYPAKSLARDASYHLVYGLGVAAAYAALDRD